MKKRAGRIFLVFCAAVAVVSVLGVSLNFFTDTRQAVEVVSEKTLIPGGQSVGIRMDVKGVLVVGLEEIETENAVVSPGYDAGIQIGDMILSVDGEDVYSAGDVSRLANASEKSVEIEVKRKEQTLKFTVSPALEYGSGQYRIGVWVKERIAGIGTLSFYDPDTGVLAALGHGIYESKTDTLLSVKKGVLMPARVSSVKEGTAGTPGEIRGIFCDDEEALGDVKKNNSMGIYAICAEDAVIKEGKPMVMALQDQVEKGDAQILTTIDGQNVEAFDIKITSVSRQREAGSKGLEIEVTDRRLLSYCGGIVQGMSGSPIIQNGRLVGAVTHVFVNDPAKGYGIFAEWMVENCKNLS